MKVRSGAFERRSQIDIVPKPQKALVGNDFLDLHYPDAVPDGAVASFELALLKGETVKPSEPYGVTDGVVGATMINPQHAVPPGLRGFVRNFMTVFAPKQDAQRLARRKQQNANIKKKEAKRAAKGLVFGK